MNDAEKKTAVLVALVKAGIVDLDSFADGLVERLPADFNPNDLGPDLGGSAGSLVGPWFVLAGDQT
ncbi:hypothetical protein PMI09_00815 [Rhizobium sp. CF122]|uniref:hypothetical protein n=1 Tax=Rhizobium sp. CF122 TaxID=1144312 RepID=UPI000271B9E3|nr:hypothetical protein [Rhizobium sp. CF122]EJL57840.1 hypothetical protein PMI09_00815 [Rhizobium sp. CF122]